MILVDTNVLIDIVTSDSHWYEWSVSRFDEADESGEITMSDVVYAEFSVRYESSRRADDVLAKLGIEIDPMPREALFLAGKAFKRYRAAGGTRTGVLPDFFIGAHAAVLEVPLLTRDARRYRTYFPTIDLIAPD